MTGCRRCPERHFRNGKHWVPCTPLWRETICRPGRIDHWMYERDNTKSLLAYNQCSHYKPRGDGWSLCT